MSTYKIFLVLGISVIVGISTIMGIPIIEQFVGLPDYNLYVEAIIDKRGTNDIGRIVIQNTGTQPLNNVFVDFGEGDILELSTIEVRDRVILTPPHGNKMEFVSISADDHIIVNTNYREEKLQE